MRRRRRRRGPGSGCHPGGVLLELDGAGLVQFEQGEERDDHEASGCGGLDPATEGDARSGGEALAQVCDAVTDGDRVDLEGGVVSLRLLVTALLRAGESLLGEACEQVERDGVGQAD